MKLERERSLRIYMFFIGGLSFFLLVVRPGLPLSTYWRNFFYYVEVFVVASFIFNTLIKFLWSPTKKHFFRQRTAEVAIISTFLLLFILTVLLFPKLRPIFYELGINTRTEAYIIIAHLFILAELLAGIGRFNARITKLPSSPGVVIIMSFIGIILLGTFLLKLPGATNHGIKFIDALFTATSATCVTGLNVVPTGDCFTSYGHNVILILVQVGGLGLMTFVTFFAIVSSGGATIKDKLFLSDTLSPKIVTMVRPFIFAIVGLTIVFEIIGAILLYFAIGGYNKLYEGQVYFAIFHSISAFCNAGFSLWSDNLINFRNNTFASLTIMGLIVIGGLGFVVLADILRYMLSFLKNRKSRIGIRLSTHTKIVMSTTIFLILIGAIGFYAFERYGVLKSLQPQYRWIASFFHSITARTAGFNTVPIESTSSHTQLLLAILMFIGASPGSTGGGIKTTTFAIMVLLVISSLKGANRVVFGKRSISESAVKSTIIVLLWGASIIIIGLMLLVFYEPDKSFLSLFFEQISAFGTVGLSTGITPSLSDASKIVIISTMLLGRIGAFTLVTTIALKRKSFTIYPTDQVIVG